MSSTTPKFPEKQLHFVLKPGTTQAKVANALAGPRVSLYHGGRMEVGESRTTAIVRPNGPGRIVISVMPSDEDVEAILAPALQPLLAEQPLAA